MNRKDKRMQGKSGIELLEEAVALLRSAPAAVVVSYFIGSLPFYLGLLYFWTDMSRSSFGEEYLPQAAFGMCLLYLWMKCWQSVFAARLKAHLGGEAPPQFGRARITRLILAQAAWQPFSLFAIPASLLMFLPYGWVEAYYHNLSLTGDGTNSIKDSSRHAWKMASLWPGQNHVMLSIAWILWCLVFVNVGTVFLFLPELLRMLLGMDNVITMSGLAILNTTFFAIIACMTQLCMNPLLKAAYVIRCFYGESLQSGADLKAELNAVGRESREFSAAGVLAIACAALTLLLFSSGSANAAEAPEVVAPQELNESIERVIEKREYQWRVPRQKKDLDEDRSAIVEFVQGIRDWFVQALKPVWDLWKKFRRWLRRVLSPDDAGAPGEGPAMTDEQMNLLLLLLGIAALILILFLWRIWRRKKQAVPEVVAQAITVVPDLKDENLVADLLPEEEWQQLASDLMARGELRLAMRALYMASLAFLAGRNLITIARYKSNREYLRELMRRARERELLLSAFSENIALFERSWYGNHEVTQQAMEAFDINHDRIRTFAQE